MKTIIDLFSRSRGADFETLLAPHIEQLYRLAYRFTGRQADAEDLVQELLLKLYPKRNQLEAVRDLKPWLNRSLYNLFVDSTRRDERNPLHNSEDPEVLAQIHSASPQPEHSLEEHDLQRQIASALNTLTPEHRALLSLHDMEGYSLPELEVMLETPLGTLKSRLHRARRKLRAQIEMEPFSAAQRVHV